MGSWCNLCIPPNFSFWTFLFHLIKYMKFLKLLFSKMVKIKEISMNIEKWLSNCLLHDDDGLVWAFVTPTVFSLNKTHAYANPFSEGKFKIFLTKKSCWRFNQKKKRSYIYIYTHIKKKKRKDVAELLKFLLRNQISTHCQFGNSPVYHLPREIKIWCRDPPEAPCVCFFPGCVEASRVDYPWSMQSEAHSSQIHLRPR